MSVTINYDSNRAKDILLTSKVADNRDEITQHFELIKIIKRYEFCVGWTLLIAPDHLPRKDVLKRCSVNLDKVLIVHKKHCSDIFNTVKRALEYDNCSALVMWDDLISDDEMNKLKDNAKQTGTALYLLANTGDDRGCLKH